MSNYLKYALVGLVLLILTVIAVIAYRMFWQFNTASIRDYANQEAGKYQNSAGAYKIILEGVEFILASHNLTMQVINSANENKTDVEQELVHAAIAQCKAFNYLPS